MKAQIKWLSSALIAVLLASTPAALADTTSPGRNAVFASQDGSLDFIELLATIEKGKRGQILKLDVFYTLFGGACGDATQACISVVRVNDLDVEPTDGGCAPCSASGCTVSGSFWFDPEASGQVGVPLDIRVVLADGGLQCTRTMAGSLAAEMVKR